MAESARYYALRSSAYRFFGSGNDCALSCSCYVGWFFGYRSMTSLRGLTLTPVGRLLLTAMDGDIQVFQEQKPSITQRPI